MEAYQIEQLQILLESMILMIRYQLRDKFSKRSFLEKMGLLKPRYLAEIREIYQGLEKFRQSINPSMDYAERYRALILLLDGYRYYFSVHLKKDYVLEKILNAMIAALFFSDAQVEVYKSLVLEKQAISPYLQELSQVELLATYEQYYKKEHSILGRRYDRLKISDVELIAKQGMINGKLFELLGEANLIKLGFKYIRQELDALLEHKTFHGFLTEEHLEGYLKTINSFGNSPPFLSPPIPPIESPEETLIKQARYILENITNACGVTYEDQARYPEHQYLVQACFWVDEMFKGVKGELVEFIA